MSSADSYDAVLIGASANSLVTAAYLAKAGLRVLVLERRSVVGGSIVTEHLAPGFRFDACAHDVGWVSPYIMKELSLSLDMIQADPSVFTPLPGGRGGGGGGHLLLWRDQSKTAEGIRRFSPFDADKWPTFTERLERLSGFLEAAYSAPAPHVTSNRASDLATMAGLGRRLRTLGRTDMIELLRTVPMSAAEFLDDWFESDVLKGTIGATGITGLMQGPRSGGTAFLMLHHHVGFRAAESSVRPSWTVRGGVGNLARELAEVARRAGAEVRLNADVARLTITSEGATGVELVSGESIATRSVVSGADPRRTFLGLMDPANLEPEFVRSVQNIRYRGAFAKVNLALDALPKFAGLNGTEHVRGAISISPSLDYLERAYDDAKHGSVSRKPYLEIRIPSLADPTLAPPGKHVMSVYMQYAPYHLKGATWDEKGRECMGDLIVKTLSEYVPGIENVILHRQVLTPKDLEDVYRLTEGSPSHGEMALDQILFMRPVAGWSRYRTPIRGLYLCGAGTHPGAGITGGPGRLAAREIMKDLKKKR
ncbi:MAG: phytoene desaturase family protein [Gemmatimonadaceae bacterium]